MEGRWRGGRSFKKIVETEDERVKLQQQLRELWEESAEESEAGSGSSSSSSKQARQKERADGVEKVTTAAGVRARTRRRGMMTAAGVRSGATPWSSAVWIQPWQGSMGRYGFGRGRG